MHNLAHSMLKESPRTENVKAEGWVKAGHEGHGFYVTEFRHPHFFSVATTPSISPSSMVYQLRKKGFTDWASKGLYSIGHISPEGLITVTTPAVGSRLFPKNTKETYLDLVARELGFEPRFIGKPTIAANYVSKREADAIRRGRSKQTNGNRAGSEMIARYLTKSGKIGLEVKRFGSSYAYVGEWGAGSGFSLDEMKKIVDRQLERRKGWRLEFTSPEWNQGANRAGNGDVEIATTIAQQLGSGTGRLGMMIGAHNFMAGSRSLTFRFKAKAKNGANSVQISLDPSDTYSVAFFSIRGTSVKSKGVFHDIYAEDLRPLFERETGLYLTMR